MNINSKQALVSITIFVLTATTIASPAVAGAAQVTNEQRTRFDVITEEEITNRKYAELLDDEVEMDASSNHMPESSPENANSSGLSRRSSPLFRHDAGRPDGLMIPNTLDQQGWFGDPDELDDKRMVSVNNTSAGASRPGGPVNPIDAGIEIGVIQLDPDTTTNSSATSSNNNPTSAPTSSSTIRSIGSNARRDSSTIASSATFWVAISMSAVGVVGLLVVTAKAIIYCHRTEDPDTDPIESEHQIEFQDVA